MPERTPKRRRAEPRRDNLGVAVPGALCSQATVDYRDIYASSPLLWVISNSRDSPRIFPCGRRALQEDSGDFSKANIIVVQVAHLDAVAQQTVAACDAVASGVEENASENKRVCEYACILGADTVLAHATRPGESKRKSCDLPQAMASALLVTASSPGLVFDCQFLHFLAIHHGLNVHSPEQSGLHGPAASALLRDMTVAAFFARRELGEYRTDAELFRKASSRRGCARSMVEGQSLEAPSAVLTSSSRACLKDLILNSKYVEDSAREHSASFGVAVEIARAGESCLPTLLGAALGGQRSSIRMRLSWMLSGYWGSFEEGRGSQHACDTVNDALATSEFDRRATEAAAALKVLEVLHSLHMTQAFLFALCAWKPALLKLCHLRGDGGAQGIIASDTSRWWLREDAAMSLFVLSLLEYCKSRHESDIPVELAWLIFERVGRCMSDVVTHDTDGSDYRRRLQGLAHSENDISKGFLSFVIDRIIGSLAPRIVEKQSLASETQCTRETSRLCSFLFPSISWLRPQRCAADGEGQARALSAAGALLDMNMTLRVPKRSGSGGVDTPSDVEVIDLRSPETGDSVRPEDLSEVSGRQNNLAGTPATVPLEPVMTRAQAAASLKRKATDAIAHINGLGEESVEALKTPHGPFYYAAAKIGQRKLYEQCCALRCHPRSLGMTAFATGCVTIPGLAADCVLRQAGGLFFGPARRACAYAALYYSEMRTILAHSCDELRQFASFKLIGASRQRSAEHQGRKCGLCENRRIQQSALEDLRKMACSVCVFDDDNMNEGEKDPDFSSVYVGCDGIYATVKWGFEKKDGQYLSRDQQARMSERRDRMIRILEPIDDAPSAASAGNRCPSTSRLRATHAYRIRMGRRGLAWRARYEMCFGYFDGALGEVMDGGVPPPTGMQLAEELPPRSPLYATELSVMMSLPGCPLQRLHIDGDSPPTRPSKGLTTDKALGRSSVDPHALTEMPSTYTPSEVYFALASLPCETAALDEADDSFSVDTEVRVQARTGFSLETIPRQLDKDWDAEWAMMAVGNEQSGLKTPPAPDISALHLTRISVRFGSVLLHRCDTSHRGVEGVAQQNFDALVCGFRKGTHNYRNGHRTYNAAEVTAASKLLFPRFHVLFSGKKRTRNKVARELSFLIQ